jgi:hypothetical protein
VKILDLKFRKERFASPWNKDAADMVKHLRLTRKKVEKSRSTKLVFAF